MPKIKPVMAWAFIDPATGTFAREHGDEIRIHFWDCPTSRAKYGAPVEVVVQPKRKIKRGKK